MNFKKEQYFIDYENQLLNLIDFFQVFNHVNHGCCLDCRYRPENAICNNVHHGCLISHLDKTTDFIKMTYEKNNGFLNSLEDFRGILSYYQENVVRIINVFKEIQNHPFILKNNFDDIEILISLNKFVQHQDWVIHLDFLPLLFKFDSKHSKNPLGIELYNSYKMDVNHLQLILCDGVRDNDYYLYLEEKLSIKETVIIIIQFILNKIIEFSYPNENQEKQKELKSEYIEALGLQDFFK